MSADTLHIVVAVNLLNLGPEARKSLCCQSRYSFRHMGCTPFTEQRKFGERLEENEQLHQVFQRLPAASHQVLNNAVYLLCTHVQHKAKPERNVW